MIVLKQYLQQERMEQLFITGIPFNCLVFFTFFFVSLRPTKESDRKISEHELYLVDSGGQYK